MQSCLSQLSVNCMHTVNSYVAFFDLLPTTNKLLDFVGHCIACYQLPACSGGPICKWGDFAPKKGQTG